MEQYKKQIIDLGYKVVEEKENGISFVNEDVETCVILLKEYRSFDNVDKVSDEEYDTYSGSNLTLDQYPFARKSTICVIVNIGDNENKEKIERDEYFFCKIFTDRIHILPSKKNKNITIKFSPMNHSNDSGDYTVNAFDYFDGLCCSNYFEFLSKAKNGDIVKYPKIINNSFFRYHANKIYSIEQV